MVECNASIGGMLSALTYGFVLRAPYAPAADAPNAAGPNSSEAEVVEAARPPRSVAPAPPLQPDVPPRLFGHISTPSAPSTTTPRRGLSNGASSVLQVTRSAWKDKDEMTLRPSRLRRRPFSRKGKLNIPIEAASKASVRKVVRASPDASDHRVISLSLSQQSERSRFKQMRHGNENDAVGSCARRG